MRLPLFGLATVCLLLLVANARLAPHPSGDTFGEGIGGQFQAQPFTRVQAPAQFEIRVNGRSFVPPAQAPQWPTLFVDPATARAHAIVQLTDWPGAETRAALERAGIVLRQPLTGRAYFATISRTVITSTVPVPGVRWAGPVPSADKLSVELRQAGSALWARRSAGQIDVVVKLFADGDMARVVSRIQQLGGSVLGRAPLAATLSATLPSGREQDLATLDDVRLIEALVPPGQGESDRVRLHVAANVGPLPIGSLAGRGVIVGVFDFRHADVTHPDFGMRATRGDTGPVMADIHPTMTAGMIAGDGSNSQSQPDAIAGARASSPSQWRGIAPAATMLTYSYNDGGDSVTNYIADVTDAVVSDAVVIANNSWGDGGCLPFAYGTYAGRAPFLDGVVRGDLGRRMAIVFSAGNERDGFGSPQDLICVLNGAAPFANYGTLNHPKSAKNVVVVGAVDSASNAMTAYSSWGPTIDGRLKPDVVASGHHAGAAMGGITSITLAFGSPFGAPNQQGYRVPAFPRGLNQHWYGWFSQTSAAAAIASGTLALVVDAWRTSFPGRADPLPSTLRGLLVQNAVDLNDGTTWHNRGPDFASGYGLISVSNTVASVQRRDVQERSVDAGASVSFRVTVAPATTSVTFTLAWDDVPALESANPALVNDLDLVVTDPAGVRHYPWTLNPMNPSADAVRTGEDHRNNLEQVVVDSGVVPGQWTIDVRGAIAQGPQSFSLIGRGWLDPAPSPPSNLRIIP